MFFQKACANQNRDGGFQITKCKVCGIKTRTKAYFNILAQNPQGIIHNRAGVFFYKAVKMVYAENKVGYGPHGNLRVG
jgi:hypothetical protein